MKKIKRPRKYFAPQNEGTERKCDHPGCEKAGEYRAPKDRKLKDYYWFCLEHVQEYNARWNYYAGEIPEEDEGPKARMYFKGFRSKVRYKHGYSFKDDFGFFGEYATDYSAIDDEIMYNAEERKCLEIMELKISEVSLESLKRQYKKLAKNITRIPIRATKTPKKNSNSSQMHIVCCWPNFPDFKILLLCKDGSSALPWPL